MKPKNSLQRKLLKLNQTLTVNHTATKVLVNLIHNAHGAQQQLFLQDATLLMKPNHFHLDLLSVMVS